MGNVTWCEYCDTENPCEETKGEGLGGPACVRPEGHSGDHISCDSTDHEVARWS